ncbi:LysM peptidoglycan-binding domain-containing protein [Spirosoma sp.]|uniref:LysM peptidoglycan-binding domain-containing protein n=1 Tax=Spirosoma sp. TaxID=1899569 RepID=UPI003B3A893C
MKILSIGSSALIIVAIVYNLTAQAHSITPNRAVYADSVGVEKKNGKRFILHRVTEGQTLYAIARRYGRSVSEIRSANPDLKESVRYGQIVRIPSSEKSTSRKEEKLTDSPRRKEKEEKREAKNTARGEDPAKAGIHVVEAGQTLYSLASRYGVSQSDLRKWNNLSGNNVLIGQALIVSEKANQVRTPSTPVPGVSTKTTEPPARTVIVHTTEPKSTTPANEPHVAEHRSTTSAEPKPDRRPDDEAANRPRTDAETANRPATPVAETRPEEEVESPRPGNDAPMPTFGRRISDSGVAEVIEGTDGSGKYLALHRTAPIGTLVQVRNEFNNQSLWVKVVGRLPNTGINDKILVKLSTQAFSKLSPQDRRFRAEVSYIVK